MTQLGDVYQRLRDYNKKKIFIERALIIFEKHYSLEHPRVARVLMNLANTYGELGDALKQKELLDRVLEIDQKYYGLKHPQVSRTLTNLGQVIIL